MARKIDQELLQIIQIFDRITHARLKDTFPAGNVHVFVVEPGEIGRAVGRKGVHVKQLAKELGRNIKIVEYSPRLEVFVKNIIHPLRASRIEVSEDGKRVTVVPVDYLTRGLLIGRNAVKLKEHEQILKHFYPQVEELRIAYPDGWEEEQKKEGAGGEAAGEA